MNRATIRSIADLAALTASDAGALVVPAEVARLFRVDPKTVTRWALAGHLPCVRTPGGHRRFRAGDVLAAIGAGS